MILGRKNVHFYIKGLYNRYFVLLTIERIWYVLSS